MDCHKYLSSNYLPAASQIGSATRRYRNDLIPRSILKTPSTSLRHLEEAEQVVSLSHLEGSYKKFVTLLLGGFSLDITK